MRIGGPFLTLLVPAAPDAQAHSPTAAQCQIQYLLIMIKQYSSWRARNRHEYQYQYGYQYMKPCSGFGKRDDCRPAQGGPHFAPCARDICQLAKRAENDAQSASQQQRNGSCGEGFRCV